MINSSFSYFMSDAICFINSIRKRLYFLIETLYIFFLGYKISSSSIYDNYTSSAMTRLTVSRGKCDFITDIASWSHKRKLLDIPHEQRILYLIRPDPSLPNLARRFSPSQLIIPTLSFRFHNISFHSQYLFLLIHIRTNVTSRTISNL